RDGKLVRSTKRYQSNVIGVYSAKPGFVGGTGEQANLNGKVPVAIVGVVAVKVTAVNGAIRPGDSLATSSIAGHAMKASQIKVNGIRFYPGGVIIGKALGTLASGRGVIKMLVVAR